MARYAAPVASFTRPADTTAYASGDLVANNTTVGSVVPLVFDISPLRAPPSGKVRGARLQKSTVTATNATFRLHVFDRAKTLTNGDNGALVFNNYDGYIASFDIDLATGAIALAGGPLTKFGAEVNAAFTRQGDSLYGYLEARAAYTPASAESFTVALSVES